jgi:hypothetical protein
VLVFWSRDPDGSQHNTGEAPTPSPQYQRADLDGRHQERRQQSAQLRKALDDPA